MPPRAKSARRSTGRQNTLSFSNKITKPSTVTASKADKTLESKANKLLQDVDVVSIPSPAVEENEPATAELAIRQQAQEEVVEVDPEEEKATQITEAQIKKYWKQKEDVRIAPRGLFS